MPTRESNGQAVALVTVKIAHTVIWALFVACILAMPVFSWLGNHTVAAWLGAIVLLEVAVLIINGWRCPLTTVASRFTDDRRANFDIYLPEWLARHNKVIFGTLFVVDVLFAIAQWLSRTS